MTSVATPLLFQAQFGRWSPPEARFFFSCTCAHQTGSPTVSARVAARARAQRDLPLPLSDTESDPPQGCHHRTAFTGSVHQRTEDPLTWRSSIQ
eukprot:7254812-Prorocentrum_lima.AAC.1